MLRVCKKVLINRYTAKVPSFILRHQFRSTEFTQLYKILINFPFIVKIIFTTKMCFGNVSIDPK